MGLLLSLWLVQVLSLCSCTGAAATLAPPPAPPAVCARATNCALAPPTAPGCLAFACAPGSLGHALPWCNASLSFAERAADLAARVPLSDVGALLQTNGAAVPTVGLPSYLYGEEGLHGVRCPSPPPKAGTPRLVPNGTTTFPEPIATAASFNDTLFHSIGSAISDEFRAFSNLRRGALSVFAPNINIIRDGRWGRGMETPGEDPTLTSRYAVGFVSGMQGNESKYLKLVTTCKHFAGACAALLYLDNMSSSGTAVNCSCCGYCWLLSLTSNNILSI
jgi:beta-D-xylosidase 4